MGTRDFRTSCKRCGTVIRVRDARQLSSRPPSAPRPPLSPSWRPSMPEEAVSPEDQAWYVALAEGQRGPFSALDISSLLEGEAMTWGSTVWREGLRDWRPARRDPLLVTAVAGARGYAGDTVKLGSSPSLEFHRSDETIVDVAPPGMLDPPRMHDDLSSEQTIARGPHSLGARSSGPPGPTTDRPSQPPLRPVQTPSPPSVGHPLAETRLVTRAEALPGLTSWLPSVKSIAVVGALAFLAGAVAATLLERKPATSDATPAIVITSNSGEHAVRAPSEPAGGVHPAPEVHPDDSPSPALDSAATEASAAIDVAGAAPRDLPEASELREAARAVTDDVRRCLPNARRGVEVDVLLEGSSGAVREVRLRTQLDKEHAACVVKAVEGMRVAPFSRPTIKLVHRFVW